VNAADDESAYEIVCSMSMTRTCFRGSVRARRGARVPGYGDFLRHETSQGVAFDSRAWRVTAKRVD
jgi:hypothetical protein